MPPTHGDLRSTSRGPCFRASTRSPSRGGTSLANLAAMGTSSCQRAAAIAVSLLLGASSVASAQQAKTPSPTAAPAAGAASRESPPEQVWVHLEAPKGTILRQHVFPEDWQIVCVAPCDRYVPTAFPYRVDAAGMLNSPSFELDNYGASSETLVVDAAYVGPHIAGFALVIVGAPVEAVGLMLTAAWAGEGFPTQQSGKGLDGLRSAVVVGLGGMGVAGMGVGAALLIPGILLLRGRTTVRQDTDVAQVVSASSPWTRTPVWARTTEWTPAPPAAGLPLLTGQF
jgi:hypothetical protein